MGETPRGADLLLDAVMRAGTDTLFTLSGNHVMPLFDAALDRDLRLIHARHEAAAVHMAEGWARMSGQVGVALVTAGQGHANAVAALCTAQAGETPLVLLSGHAPRAELGLGSFQELRQAELAAPVTKASWTAERAETLADDVARAWRIARSGRPGPVHVSLPADLLEAGAGAAALPDATAFDGVRSVPDAGTVRQVLDQLARAARPLVIAPPALTTRAGNRLLMGLRDALGVPVIAMESPRGVDDPSLGDLASLLAAADLILLLAKPLDFTLRFGRPPAIAADCRWIVLDPDPALRARAATSLGDRLVLCGDADAAGAALALTDAGRRGAAPTAGSGWRTTVDSALAFRPADWPRTAGDDAAPLHPAVLGAAVQGVIDRHPGAVLVSDGGEIGQWAQATIRAPHRLINGVAGAIGPALPFAIGAKAARPDALVVAVMGDGTFGFHMAELDTAARCGLPVLVVVGNDGRWNAEHQIQLRRYGADRAQGCALAPGTRYDLVAPALGGHGERVTRGHDLAAALDRAVASGRPAVVDVAIDGRAAPVIRLR